MLIDPVATSDDPAEEFLPDPGLDRSVRGVAVAHRAPRKSRPGSERSQAAPCLFYDSVGFRVTLTRKEST